MMIVESKVPHFLRIISVLFRRTQQDLQDLDLLEDLSLAAGVMFFRSHTDWSPEMDEKSSVHKATYLPFDKFTDYSYQKSAVSS